MLLEIGFITSIRREWAWRVSRGESLKNLKAFEHLIREEDLADGGPDGRAAIRRLSQNRRIRNYSDRVEG